MCRSIDNNARSMFFLLIFASRCIPHIAGRRTLLLSYFVSICRARFVLLPERGNINISFFWVKIEPTTIPSNAVPQKFIFKFITTKKIEPAFFRVPYFKGKNQNHNITLLSVCPSVKTIQLKNTWRYQVLISILYLYLWSLKAQKKSSF